jgi:hypothetical protein
MATGIWLGERRGRDLNPRSAVKTDNGFRDQLSVRVEVASLQPDLAGSGWCAIVCANCLDGVACAGDGQLRVPILAPIADARSARDTTETPLVEGRRGRVWSRVFGALSNVRRGESVS